MAPVIKELNRTGWANVSVVSTGQHREMVGQILSLFDIQLDHDLDVMEPNQSLCGLSSKIFARLDTVLDDMQPDLILVQGDTTSVMIASLAAFYKKIPVGHVEAGLRTHDLNRPFPEELNRVVAGVVADLHFAPTKGSYDNLIAENKPADHVFETGNTVIDSLLEIADKNFPCPYPSSPNRRLVLVTAHRRENFGAPLKQICEAIKELHDKNPNLEFVYPVHPNPNVKAPVYDALGKLERVTLLPPADYHDLVMLIKNSYLILTDSGGIQEEAPGLKKPVLILRDETERPEAVDAGIAKLVGADKKEIISWVSKLLDDPATYKKMASGGSPYGDGKASQRIAKHCFDFLHPSKTSQSEHS